MTQAGGLKRSTAAEAIYMSDVGREVDAEGIRAAFGTRAPGRAPISGVGA